MIFFKILNLIDDFGQVDYKGLDINQFVPGSQVYAHDTSKCVIATNENVVTTHEDVYLLSKEQYLAEKEAILSAYPKPRETVLEETIAAQQEQIDQLTIILGDALLEGGI